MLILIEKETIFYNVTVSPHKSADLNLHYVKHMRV